MGPVSKATYMMGISTESKSSYLLKLREVWKAWWQSNSNQEPCTSISYKVLWWPTQGWFEQIKQPWHSKRGHSFHNPYT
jgi:hypothetical protein